MAIGELVLDVKDLKTYFYTRRGVVRAVDGVSFSLHRGESIGLVGESGCGKTVTCLSLLRLEPQPAGRIVGGEILLFGEDLVKKSQKEMCHIRGKYISMVLQDPMTGLNPVFTIGFQLGEAIKAHQGLRGAALIEKAKEMLHIVAVPSPAERLRNFPHEMSGGMRQRVVGAIAISCQPTVLIADEPTTSLDVTTQRQYLKLLREMQESGVCLIFITHDFGIVSEVCQRVNVMYAGRIVETGTVFEIFDEPVHPYTQAMHGSVPVMDGDVTRLTSITGEPPQLRNLPSGCYFHPRCSRVKDRCRQEYPPVTEIAPGHLAACWEVTK